MADTTDIVIPPQPKLFDPEELITYDELAPSLQDKLKSIDRNIEMNMTHFDELLNNYRITISWDPPMNPEPDRDLWFDLNYDTFRFYMSKNNDNNYYWEFTRGAWYGGSSTDIKKELIPSPTTKWSKVKSLVWLSNVATKNTYTANKEMPRSMHYTVNKAGYYRIRDNSNLFEYNAQRTYTHDGGRITLNVYKQPKGGTSTSIYQAIYDSKITYRAYNPVNQTYPDRVLQCNVGDKIISNVITNRNPQSTDEVCIYQISSILVYRLNFGNPNVDDSGDSIGPIF